MADEVVRDIPEEMVELRAAIIAALCTDHGHVRRAGGMDCRTCARRADAVLAALAGRQVVDLPEPDANDDEDDPPTWHVDGVDDAVESHPDTAEVDFAYWTWSHATASAFAAALLAAADRAAPGGE